MDKKTEALKLARAVINDTAYGAPVFRKEVRNILVIIDEALAEQPVQQQETVATGKQFLQVEELLKDMLDTLPYNSPDYWINRIKEVMPLYTSPPTSKPWVGLESQDFDGVIKSDAFEAGAYWANNILREKNQ